MVPRGSSVVGRKLFAGKLLCSLAVPESPRRKDCASKLLLSLPLLRLHQHPLVGPMWCGSHRRLTWQCLEEVPWAQGEGASQLVACDHQMGRRKVLWLGVDVLCLLSQLEEEEATWLQLMLVEGRRRLAGEGRRESGCQSQH